MTESKSIQQMMNDLPAATNASDRTILMADSNGNLAKVSISDLATAVRTIGKMISTEFIIKNSDIDANNLSEYNVIYTVGGDINQWNQDIQWLNMPTARPEGGFTLWCIREGSYKRQFYHKYMDAALYMRFSYSSGGKQIWSAWRKFTADVLS